MARHNRKHGQTWPGFDPDEPGPLDGEGDEPLIEFLKKPPKPKPKRQVRSTEGSKRCRKRRR